MSEQGLPLSASTDQPELSEAGRNARETWAAEQQEMEEKALFFNS